MKERDSMAVSETTHMQFVGVTTRSSFVHNVFEGWASCLGASIILDPQDISLGAPPDVYRTTITALRNGYPTLRGALITSHKAAVFDSCADMFDCVSEDAARLGEVGMVYWSDDRFCAGANDVFSTQRVATELLLNSGNWLDGCRRAVILGAGGAGVALANTMLLDPELRCTEVIIVESNGSRADRISELVKAWDSKVPVSVIQSTGLADEVVKQSGVGSLIVNATGLGKDRPGSPVSRRVVFPEKSFIWEFNYRFLQQEMPTFLETAREQESKRGLKIEDGWDYFIWGWLVVMSRVLAIDGQLDSYYPCFRKVAESSNRQLTT